MNLLEVKERIMAYESIKSNLPEMKYKEKENQTIDFFLSNFSNIKGEKLDKLKSLLEDFLKRMASDSYYYYKEELCVPFIFQDEKYLDFIPNDCNCFKSLLRFLIEIKGTKNLEWMNLNNHTFIPFITMMNKMYNHPSEKVFTVNKLKKLYELNKISNDFSKIEAAMIFNKVIDIENHLDL